MDYTEQYSEWLSAYLDGELEPTLEEPLFGALATHAELRREMRELLALRRAARNDLVALVPPLSTTAAVFQSVGIGTGVGAGLGLLRRLWMPLASALVGGALTWLGMTLTNQSPPDTAATVTARQPAAVSSPATTAQPTVVERIVYRTKTVYVPVAAPSSQSPQPPQMPTVQQQPIQQQPAPPLLAELPQFDLASPPLVVRRIAAIDTTAPDIAVTYAPERPELPPIEQYPQFRLTVRGLATTSLVTVPQQPDRSSLLNTSAIGFSYVLGDHHAIGIEIGREPFAMQFYGYREDTRLRYEAYPALLWGTATYQYRTRWGRYFEPLAQIGLGASEFGLLGRATLGVVYRPAPSLGVMLGIEGALMRYVYQSVPYWTPNVGLTYGVMFRF